MEGKTAAGAFGSTRNWERTRNPQKKESYIEDRRVEKGSTTRRKKRVTERNGKNDVRE